MNYADRQKNTKIIATILVVVVNKCDISEIFVLFILILLIKKHHLFGNNFLHTFILIEKSKISMGSTSVSCVTHYAYCSVAEQADR